MTFSNYISYGLLPRLSVDTFYISLELDQFVLKCFHASVSYLMHNIIKPNLALLEETSVTWRDLKWIRHWDEGKDQGMLKVSR